MPKTVRMGQVNGNQTLLRQLIDLIDCDANEHGIALFNFFAIFIVFSYATNIRPHLGTAFAADKIYN